MRNTMMASRCQPQYFLNPRHSLQLLPLVVTMTMLFSVTESAAQSQLRGEVGGNVTFNCPAKQKNIAFFYLQKDHLFINGLHASKKMPITWSNTRLVRDKTVVNMFRLNVSHSGDYECLIMYMDEEFTRTVIHLSVTANYSKPEVKVYCSDENSRFGCLVTCSSHGGYPGTKMTWNVNGSQMWKVVNSSQIPDPDTMMVNSSSTAYFNCSSGDLKVLTCSVGDVTSNNISVCTTKDPPDTSSPFMMAVAAAAAALCLVVTFIVVIMIALRWKYKKGQMQTGATAAAAGDMRERIALNGRGGEGAP